MDEVRNFKVLALGTNTVAIHNSLSCTRRSCLRKVRSSEKFDSEAAIRWGIPQHNTRLQANTIFSPLFWSSFSLFRVGHPHTHPPANGLPELRPLTVCRAVSEGPRDVPARVLGNLGRPWNRSEKRRSCRVLGRHLRNSVLLRCDASGNTGINKVLDNSVQCPLWTLSPFCCNSN